MPCGLNSLNPGLGGWAKLLLRESVDERKSHKELRGSSWSQQRCRCCPNAARRTVKFCRLPVTCLALLETPQRKASMC